MQHAELKKQATNTLLSIFVFILCYVILIAASLALTAVLTVAGIAIMTIGINSLTVIVGVGLIGIGLFVTFFLIKFIFSRSKTDRSGMIEITEADEPKLFALIRELTTTVKTPFPKKVYLSTDVNASVFYDSTFLSLFLPAKKNLNIGIGLVNSLTALELKAVLAHEFGHFSQESMRVGSYVYQVNRVIYNLIYDNSSIEKIVESVSSWNSILGFAGYIGVSIIKGIQALLRQLYSFVNLSYRKLSREMEFHADEVAASITGAEAVRSSLAKLDLTGSLYNEATEFCNNQIGENQRPVNFYPLHSHLIAVTSQLNSIELINGLPDIKLDSIPQRYPSRLKFTDLWASHPENDERYARASSHGFKAVRDDHSTAWIYFKDPVKTGKQLTDKLYETVNFETAPELTDTTRTNELYDLTANKHSINEAFNGYYDDHDPEKFDLKDAMGADVPVLQEVFSDHVVAATRKLVALNRDDHTIQQFLHDGSTVKKFEFDGEQFSRNDIPIVIQKIADEKKELEKEISIHDKAVCKYFIENADEEQRETIREAYNEFFKAVDQLDKEQAIHNKLIDLTGFMYQTNTYENINAGIIAMKGAEQNFKDELRILIDKFPEEFTNEKQLAEIHFYTDTKLEYFAATTYIQDNLDRLHHALEMYRYLSNLAYQKAKSRLFDQQLALMNVNTEAA